MIPEDHNLVIVSEFEYIRGKCHTDSVALAAGAIHSYVHFLSSLLRLISAGPVETA